MLGQTYRVNQFLVNSEPFICFLPQVVMTVFSVYKNYGDSLILGGSDCRYEITVSCDENCRLNLTLRCQ